MHSPSQWIDIESPDLARIHEVWIKLRGAEGLPPASSYNAFAAAVPAARSICAIWPLSAPEPSFKSVGADMAILAPKIAVGLPFSSVESALSRSIWNVPLQRAMETRMPQAAPVKIHRKGNVEMFESLILPFASLGNRAGLAHAVFDLSKLSGDCL